MLNFEIPARNSEQIVIECVARALPGPNLLPRAYASAVAEVNSLTWSLALERALSNKA